MSVGPRSDKMLPAPSVFTEMRSLSDVPEAASGSAVVQGQEEEKWPLANCSCLLLLVNWHTGCDMMEAPAEVRWVIEHSSEVKELKPWVSVSDKDRPAAEGRRYSVEGNRIFFTLFYCRDFPSHLLPHVRNRCSSPSLCRDDYSAALWKPDIPYPVAIPVAEPGDGLSLLDVYARLGSEVLQAMLTATKHVKQARPASHLKRKLSSLDTSLEHVISLLGLAQEQLSPNVSLRVLRPAKLQLNDFMRTDNASTFKQWTPFSQYMSDPAAAQEFGPMTLKPGFGGESISLAKVFFAIKTVLRAHALQDSFLVEVSAVTAGTLVNYLPGKTKAQKRVAPGKQVSKVLLDPVWVGAGKTSCAKRLVWLSRFNVLQDLLDRGQVPTFQRTGVLRYVVKEGSMGRLWGLHPEVTELPDADGQAMACKPEGERVIAVLLSDLHELQFSYTVFAAILQQLRGHNSGGLRKIEMKTLYAWLGLCMDTRIWPEIPAGLKLETWEQPVSVAVELGTQESTTSKAEEMEATGVNLFHIPLEVVQKLERSLGFTLTASQLSILQTVTKPFVHWQLIAGGSKTTLLLAAGVCALCQDDNLFFWVITKSKAMAADAFCVAQRLFAEKEAILLTVERQKEKYVDHGYKFLAKAAQDPGATDIGKLGALDNVIAIVWKAWDKVRCGCDMYSPYTASTLRKTLVRLLAQRHMYLDSEVYAAIKDRQVEACKYVKCAVITMSAFLKHLGSPDSWLQWLGKDKRLLGALDEFELYSDLELIAAVSAFVNVIAAGDSYQKPWQTQQYSHNVTIDSVLFPEDLDSEWRPGRSLAAQPAERWASRNSMIKTTAGWETFRFGDNIVHFLHKVFPDLNQLQSKKKHDRGRVLPILFEDLYRHDDWKCHGEEGTGEVLRSETAFSVLVSVAALEIMATYAHGRGHHDILFLWF